MSSECALTPFQLEVVRWVSQGKTQRDAAELMGVSYCSVTKSLQKAFQKTATFHMPHLVALSLRKGWIE